MKFIGSFQLKWMRELTLHPERAGRRALSAYGVSYDKPEEWTLCCLGQACVLLHGKECFDTVKQNVFSPTITGNHTCVSYLSPDDYKTVGLYSKSGGFCDPESGFRTNLKIPIDLDNVQQHQDFATLTQLNDDHPEGWKAVVWAMKRYPEFIFKEPK